MAVYLKQFENNTQYEEARQNLILPNVSFIEDTSSIKYNPLAPESRLIAVYNITDTSQSVNVFNEFFGGFTSMEIDGVELPEVTSSYSFDTTGEHTIKFGLNSQADIAEAFFSYGMSSGELTSVVIPNSVTSIGNGAFHNCSGLVGVDIPNSVTSIDENAFYGCRSLTNIVISNSVTSIGENAFNGCDVLTSVAIGSGVTSIGDNAFGYCGSLTNITIDSNNNTYDSRDNCNAIIETSTNTLLRGCQNTVFPNSVTSIGNGAFNGCSNLTSIAIPNSVTSIGEGAFWGCSNLTSITIPNSVTSIGRSAFYYCTSLTSIGSVGSGASVEIPSGVTSISESLFDSCSNLTSIDIPNSVTSIGDSAFNYCRGLTSCTIGSGVTSIGSSAFYYCSSLTSITCNAMVAPTIFRTTFQQIKRDGTLTVPSGSSGYNTWMQYSNYYLGVYGWHKVEK